MTSSQFNFSDGALAPLELISDFIFAHKRFFQSVTEECPSFFRPYKCPIVIPIAVLLISLFLVIAPIVDNPKMEYIYALVFIIGGALTYIPFVKFRIKMPFMGKFCQRW